MATRLDEPPVRVLHLITELSTGGAQSALFRYLEASNRSRFEPTVACLYNGDQVIAEQIRSIGIDVYDLGMNSKISIAAVWRFVKLLRAQRPRILHTWMYHANVLGRVIGWLTRVPTIITSRRNVEIGGQSREWIKRWTSTLDHAVIAVCEKARLREIAASNLPDEKVVTVYNGLSLEHFILVRRQTTRLQIRDELALSPQAVVIGVVGRLHPQKGHLHLIDAFATVQQTMAKTRGPSIYLLIAGDGSERDAIEKQIQRLALSENIALLGTRSDVPELLAGMDIFVLPSLWEGLPNVLLEAMAAQLPVVATAVGGTPEIVLDGETGILTAPADSAALGDALLTLINNPTLRNKLGQAGRRRVETSFSIQQMTKSIEGLYVKFL